MILVTTIQFGSVQYKLKPSKCRIHMIESYIYKCAFDFDILLYLNVVSKQGNARFSYKFYNEQ